MPDLPTATANNMLNAGVVAGTTYYLSQHTADPSTSGQDEVDGGGYVRQPIIFSSSTENGQASTDAQTFVNMPSAAGNLWCGLWTAQTGGSFVWGDPTAAVEGPIAPGASVVYQAGQVNTGPIS